MSGLASPAGQMDYSLHMKLAIAFVLLAACGADKPAPATPIANHPVESTPPPSSEQAELDRKVAAAEREANEARKLAQEAQEQLDKLALEIDDMSRRVDKAVEAVVSAQNDADRGAAAARLKQLQQEQAEMRARVARAKEAAIRAERLKGIKIDPKCLDNPLARGCS
jgi:TolA-binding protein